MHPHKAEALAKLAEVCRELDSEMDHLKDIARNPGRNGWTSTLQALATLPALGVGALLVDAGEVIIRRTSDSKWERDSPKDSTAAPPNEEL
jgi:hypothetical protein